MEFLVVLFVIAGSVWLVPVVQSGRLVAIGLLTLSVGTVFGPSFFSIDGPIQISLDRVLWIGMFVLVLIGFRLGYTTLPTPNRLDFLVLGIVVWFFISCLRGGPPPTGSSPVAKWLFYILMPSAMYFLARMTDIRRPDVRLLLGISIGLGTYLALTGLCEVTEHRSLVFPSYINDPEDWKFLGRARGPLLNPIGNGILLTISLVASTVGLIYAGRRGKIAYGFAALIFLAGIYATLTRSVWIGAFAAMGTIALIYSPRWVRVLSLAAVLLLGGAAVFGVKDQLFELNRDKALSPAESAKSIELRPLLAVVAWEMFKDRPIIGHGYGHYFEHNRRYHDDRGYGLPLGEVRGYQQHNVFLSILVDTGLVGITMVLAWLAMLCGVAWNLARQFSASVESQWLGLILIGNLIAYGVNGLFHDVMVIPMMHMFLFFFAGLAVTVYYRGLAPATNREPISNPVRSRQAMA